MEHLTNCHGEWNALLAMGSSLPFIGFWLKAKIGGGCEKDSNH
tara:strand:+ start:52 stop:180 length:129 start_codon:yes stop_codon:yes gene_type:complete